MLSLLAASVLSSPQKTIEPQKLSERITFASMFKNGFAVIMREMDVPRDGDFILERIPQASLGTLWFTTSEGSTLTSVISTEIDGQSKTSAQTIQDLLALNVGKRVTLTLNNGDPVSGTLINASGALLEVKIGDQTTVLDRAAVTRVVSNDALTDSSPYVTQTRALRFHLDSHGPAKIFMLSLEKGLSWSPAYAVTLKEGKKLEVVGKATVTNDLEALPGIETRFITGWPNLPYAESRDPLVDFQSIVATATSGGFGGGGAMGNMSFGRGAPGANAFLNQAPAARDLAASMPISDLQGIQAEDLFFYRQPGVALKVGDRGYFVVLSMEAPYDELYTWDVPDFVADGQYASGPITSAAQEVWHSIRFTNTSKVPFSTGPATIFKEGQIIGQDATKYTPAGAKSELRITQALDLSADQLEEEVSRERGALKNVFNQPTYDLVTIRGTLTLTSHKAETVTARIRKNLTGEVTRSTGKVTRVARGLRDTNTHAQIEWTEKVEPGKTLTQTYEYKVYIRS